MFESIHSFFEELSINQTIKLRKNLNVNGPDLLKRDENLKKYIPLLKEIGKKQHELFFETLDKTDLEHLFAKLVIQRQNEYYQSIILLVGFDFPITAIPIMRSLCDSLFLLEYVEKNPNYIKKFMETTRERGVNVKEIKSTIDDQPLIDYYDFLSGLMHSNPVGIKMNFHRFKDRKSAIISVLPAHSAELNESHIYSLIKILTDSQRIVNNIYETKWKSGLSNPKTSDNE